MADQTDDRGLSTRAEGSKELAPQRHVELLRSTTEQPDSLASASVSAMLHTAANPARAPVSQSAADLPRPGSEAAHVAALSSALAQFGTTVRTAIDTAAKAGDADTADLFTEVSRGVDKLLWLVEAHMQAKE